MAGSSSRVGDRNRGGEVAAGVKGGGRVWVNAYNGSGLTVDVSFEDARELALGILAMTDPDVLR